MKFLKHNNIRFIFTWFVITACFLVLVYRLANLHLVDNNFLREQGDARTLRIISVPAYRGMITDRHGEPLAISTPVKSVWINPRKFDSSHPNFDTFLEIMELSEDRLKNKLTANKDKEFMYVRRHIQPQISELLQKLEMPGLHLQSEYRRFYPAGEVTAHLLGFTNIDDKGLEGVELALDNWLSGKPGKTRIIKDRVGRNIEYLEDLVKVKHGKDLALSIDERLQYLAFRELRNAVEKHGAQSGSAVIIHVPSSEIYAITNYPSFNPNDRSRSKLENYRNAAVTDTFEPASAMKTFSMLSVIENNKNFSPSMLVDTSPGKIEIGAGIVRDLKNNGKIDATEILRYSSNIGIARLVLDLPENSLINTYQRLGFGASTGSGFPGENHGYIQNVNKNQEFTLATMSFGYGLTVTPLQLARAYAILGAGGIKRPISFVKNQHTLPGTRVVTTDQARKVVEMLTGAVINSRSKAKVIGYKVAGKTGTARKLGKYGYDKERHFALFGGLAPAINPQFAIVVTINEPSSGKYYGNQIVAPVFSKIASGALRLYNISPDVLDSHGIKMAFNERSGL